jgi:cyanate permease
MIQYPQDSQASSYRFAIAALLVFLNFGLGLSFFAIAPVLPLIQDDYGINRSTASLLVVVVILAQTLFCIPGGAMVVRMGIWRVIGIGWFLASVPVLALVIDGFIPILLLRVVYGVGFALVIPAIGPLTMQWFKPREIPFINSMGLAAATLAVSISTFSAAPLADLLGWRVVLSLFSVVTLTGALVWIVFGREGEMALETPQGISLRDIWVVFRSRSTILLALADLGPFAQYVALTTWLPTYYHEKFGMTLSEAGFIAGLLPLSGLVALACSAILSLRIRRRKPFLIVPGIFIGFAGFASFLVGDNLILPIVVVLLGVCSWIYIPFLFTIPIEMPGMSTQRLALMMAVIVTIGSIGSIVSPWLVGFTTDLLGTYWVGFSILAIGSMSLLLAGRLLPETGQGRKSNS